MNRFDPNILIPKSGFIKGELFDNPRFDLPITLFWKISIPLEDFILGDIPIYDSQLEFGRFTLPHVSVVPKFDAKINTLKSWKSLPNQTFGFTNSFVDNIGSIYYYIKNKDVGDYFKGTIYDEQKEFYDNCIDIHKIEFGGITKNQIKLKIWIRIEFDAFNMHDPPFRKDWYSDVFKIETNIEIKEINLLSTSVEVKDEVDAINLAKKGLEINDYNLKSEIKQIFTSINESENKTFYSFFPDFST